MEKNNSSAETQVKHTTMGPCQGEGEPLNENFKIGESLQFQRHILPWKQKYQWDCGISCIAMISSLEDRYELYRNLHYYQTELEFGNSTWTIDLCYILQKLNKSFTFVTKFRGVDPTFKNYSFYRNIIDQDTERVYKRFDQAAEHGIEIFVRRINLEEILQHVFQRGPAIVLVNANLLCCLDCSWTSSCITFSYCFRQCFQGHYVLLIGFDLKKRWIYYNNPTFSDRSCRMYLEDFEKARTAAGTDWDVILITTNEQF